MIQYIPFCIKFLLNRVGAKWVHLLTLTSCTLDPKPSISSLTQPKHAQKPRQVSLKPPLIKPFNDRPCKPLYTRANLHPLIKPLTSSKHFPRGFRELLVRQSFFECTLWIVGALFNDRSELSLKSLSFTIYQRFGCVNNLVFILNYIGNS